MEAKQIRSLLERAPFKPFQLELDNGRKITIKHPDYIFFNASENAAVVPSEGKFEIIALNYVASLETAA